MAHVQRSDVAPQDGLKVEMTGRGGSLEQRYVETCGVVGVDQVDGRAETLILQVSELASYWSGCGAVGNGQAGLLCWPNELFAGTTGV